VTENYTGMEILGPATGDNSGGSNFYLVCV